DQQKYLNYSDQRHITKYNLLKDEALELRDRLNAAQAAFNEIMMRIEHARQHPDTDLSLAMLALQSDNEKLRTENVELLKDDELKPWDQLSLLTTENEELREELETLKQQLKTKDDEVKILKSEPRKRDAEEAGLDKDNV